MAEDWPPRSPQAALLSSPGGRKKFRHHQDGGTVYTSPLRHLKTTPTLRRSSPDHLQADEALKSAGSEEDEDEEILHLKLAAIEAKLKLKKLQQSKAKLQEDGSGFENSSAIRPPSRLFAKPDLAARGPAVEVPFSPIKRPPNAAEQRSPHRVVLGIDKGLGGGDVSLRRARGSRDNTSHQLGPRPSSRSTAFSSVQTTDTISSGRTHVKSFNERLSESRETDKNRALRREERHARRGRALKLDRTQVEAYRKAATEAQAHSPLRSPTRRTANTEYSREEVLNARVSRSSSRTLQSRRSVPNLRSPTRLTLLSPGSEDGPKSHQSQQGGDASLYESFSQVHLTKRILPHSFLERTLQEDPDHSFDIYRVPDLLKVVHAPAYELPESVIDCAIVGIIASKSSPHSHKPGAGAGKSGASMKSSNDWEKQWDDGSQNQKKFMVLQLIDLKWSIDVFLFGTALPRYHRLTTGTVVAILNPAIMPPKKGKEDTGAFSLTLHSSDDTVLEIGTARDLGFCKAVKKDGKECGSWVDATKSVYCEWHVNAQVTRVQSSRMGVNTGTNGFSNGRGQGSKLHYNARGSNGNLDDGLLPRKEGRQFDKHTGTQYFIAGSAAGSGRSGGAPVYQGDRSAAKLLDLDDDDPFIAEGQLSRDKDARLRKRLIVQEKERAIARDLGKMGTGGAGGEYMRQRTGTGAPEASEQGSQRSALAAKVGIMSSGAEEKGSGKRSAENVRLSPVKKTRLMTQKGIRHPGRESLGVRHEGDAAEDDDLDII